jgi:hypothetical protein
MAYWFLLPCLVQLRTEFNLIAPARDRASDGSIGDQAHADRVSSHNPDETGAVPVRDADSRNEVHAIDVDVDLRTPGLTMEMVVQHLVARSRAGMEDRLRNIIYNRRIWAASSGWRQQAYGGDNPHTEHAHFEGSYASAAESDTHSWHLEDIPVALTAGDKKDVREIFDEALKAWAKVDPLASIFARTGYLANVAVPALAASVASLDTADVDEAELASRLAALIPDGLAQRVADELAVRLAS